MCCNEVYVKNHFDEMRCELGEVRKTHLFCYYSSATLDKCKGQETKSVLCHRSGKGIHHEVQLMKVMSHTVQK